MGAHPEVPLPEMAVECRTTIRGAQAAVMRPDCPGFQVK